MNSEFHDAQKRLLALCEELEHIADDLYHDGYCDAIDVCIAILATSTSWRQVMAQLFELREKRCRDAD